MNATFLLFFIPLYTYVRLMYRCEWSDILLYNHLSKTWRLSRLIVSFVKNDAKFVLHHCSKHKAAQNQAGKLVWLSGMFKDFRLSVLKSDSLNLHSPSLQYPPAFDSNVSSSPKRNSPLRCPCYSLLQRGHLTGLPLSPEVRRFSLLSDWERASPGPVDGAEEPLMAQTSAPFTAIRSSSSLDMCN